MAQLAQDLTATAWWLTGVVGKQLGEAVAYVRVEVGQQEWGRGCGSDCFPAWGAGGQTGIRESGLKDRDTVSTAQAWRSARQTGHGR